MYTSILVQLTLENDVSRHIYTCVGGKTWNIGIVLEWPLETTTSLPSVSRAMPTDKILFAIVNTVANKTDFNIAVAL